MTPIGTLTIEGFRLKYRIEGEGRPVLLVGSALYYPRLFDPALTRDQKWVYVDHRGFAEEAGSLDPEAHTLDRVVEDLEVMRRELGLEDVILVGHSGHAFIAVEYALRYPEHVSKLALFNTAPTNTPERQRQSFACFDDTASPERKRHFEAEIAKLADDLAREPERRFAHVCIRMGAHSFYDFTTDGAPLWDGVTMTMPIIDHLWGEAFAQLDLRERLPLLNKPVLLGLGRYDYLVGPLSLWDDIEMQCPHVSKVVFERSGHTPMLEQAEDFAFVWHDWLGRDA
jgi:Predicted hydrolases or acyltransferases (alpha/beta hydrolase superfamily)